MQIDTRVNSEEESLSQALMVVRIIFMRDFFRVSLGNHFDLTGSESIFGILEDLPIVSTHLLTKMDASEEAHG